MKKIILFFVLIQTSLCVSQELHQLEPASHHYASLKALSALPNEKRAELDSMRFPESSYNPVALLYTMASPIYLTDNQVDGFKNLLKFPANSSEQTQAELNFLLEWQKKRTKEQEYRTSKVLAPIGYWPHIDVMKDHKNFEANIDDLLFEGREVMGAKVTHKNYPATTKLLKGITNDMRLMEFTIKYHLLRPRPYELEPKLEPLQIMGSPSFASGHTLWAYLHAFTWSELIPSKRAAFLALAYEIGESREIMGIHYPSDDEASRILAHAMLTKMWSNTDFASDLKAAQLEWRQ